jgi:hypothetical protein
VPEVELSAGTIEYEDTGGEGLVFVLLHGVGMDGSLWRHVVAELRPDFRCVVPTLPLGGHRRPMRSDADLSLRGMVRLVPEVLQKLDLRDVTSSATIGAERSCSSPKASTGAWGGWCSPRARPSTTIPPESRGARWRGRRGHPADFSWRSRPCGCGP